MPVKLLGFEINIDKGFYNAITQSDLETIKNIVENNKIDLSKPISTNGFNYIHLAVFEDSDPDIIKYFYANGADVNASFSFNGYLYRALTIFGIGYGVNLRKENIKALLECNAKVAAPEGSSNVISILDLLSKRGEIELYNLCRARLAPEVVKIKDQEAWFMAVKRQDFRMVKNLVENCNFNVNTPEDKRKFTALFYICTDYSEAGKKIFKYLLAKGANPNIATLTSNHPVSQISSTPLLNIIVHGHEDNFAVLINHPGIDLDLLSPLCMAAIYGRTNMVEKLLKNGASKNQTYGEKNALVCATESFKIKDPKDKANIILYLSNFMNTKEGETTMSYGNSYLARNSLS